MGRHWSIGTRMLGLVAAIVLPFVAIIGYEQYLSTEREVAAAGEGALGFARLIAASVQHDIIQTRDVLAGAVARPSIQALDPDHCDPLVTSIPRLRPSFIALSLIDLDGNLVCNTTPLPGARHVNFAGRDWFRQVLGDPRFVLGAPSFEEALDDWCVMAALPVKADDGHLIGVLAASIHLSHFQPLQLDGVLPAGSIVTILDGAGAVVARSSDPAEWIGRHDGGSTPIGALLEAERGWIERPGPDGRIEVAAAAPIFGSDWSTVVSVPRAQILAPAWQRLRTDAGLVGGLVLLVVIGAVVSRRHMVQPLRGLIAAAEAATEDRPGRDRRPGASVQRIAGGARADGARSAGGRGADARLHRGFALADDPGPLAGAEHSICQSALRRNLRLCRLRLRAGGRALGAGPR